MFLMFLPMFLWDAGTIPTEAAPSVEDDAMQRWATRCWIIEGCPSLGRNPIFCLWGCPIIAFVVLTDCSHRSVIAFQLIPDQTVLVGL